MADTSTLGPLAAPERLPPTATLDSAGSESPAVLPRGFAIGRYVVLERIGQGGMGAVYAAYDPELDRRVALKVLRGTSAHAGPAGDGAAAARLLGEARALARLEHPNVLRVYDVGSDRGQVYLTTELLDGLDVAAWAAAQPRSWQEIVDVFLAVGAGLAAAHAEGLVHCDIKPTNMMVCRDGRVLLVDFGIAAEAAGGEGSVLDAATLDLPVVARRPAGSTPALAGTPGYMAPEQARGEALGPAADIYSFCLSLGRLLFGRVPSAVSGETAAAVASSEAAAPGLPKVPKGVARRLRVLLARGTAEDPAARPGSLAEVLAGLRDLREQRRRRLLALAGLGVTVLLVHFLRTILAPPASCFDGEARFAATFSAARREALASRFAASPSGSELFAATRATIERYGEAWRAQGEAWCREARRGASSEVLLDLRNECLEQRRRELDASLTLATSRQDLEPGRIAEMFANLQPISVCSDTRALRSPAEPTLDAGQRQQLAELRRRQATLRAMWNAGVMKDGRAATPPLLEEAQRLGHLPLVAELLYQRGLFEDALVEPSAAATLQEAALTAAACRHDRSIAEALIRLVRVAGLRQELFAEADHFAELARVALDSLSRPGLLAAELADFEGLNARQQGHYQQALELHLRALAMREQELPADHPILANSHLRLGILLDDQNRQAEARQHLEQALRIQLAAYGPAHPSIADTYTRLGSLAREEEHLDEARELHEKALALRRRLLGEERPPVAESRTYLGELAALRGDLELARSEFAAASAILVRELGPQHSRVGVLLATEASAFTEAGRDAEAVEPYHQALAIFEKNLGSRHPQVGILAFNLGAVYLRLGRFALALDHYRRAQTILRASMGAESSFARNALAGQGEALERLGRDQEARAILEQVLALDDRLGTAEDRGAKFRADTTFALARLLLKTSNEKPQARRLALVARDLYNENPQASRRELAELETWLNRIPG